MTVNSSASSVTVPGTGSATTFSFPFIGVGAPYIEVLYTDASGNQTQLTQGPTSSDFQVSLNPAVPGAIWGLGGTVTYDPPAGPIASGTTLTISRVLPFLQSESLANQGNLSTLASSSEQAIDLVDMQVQQLDQSISYAIQANPANSRAPIPLPPAAQAAGLGLVFSSSGLDLIAGELPATGVISSAMAPVVGAATLAAGRTAFGLGALAIEGFGAGLGDDGAGNARVNQTVTVDAANAPVDKTFAWTLRVTGSALTYTLAAGASLWNGFTFSVDALAGAAVLNIASNDKFAGQSSGASFTVPLGYTAVIITDGAANATWYVRLSPATTAGFLPTGMLAYFPFSTPPTGWLQNNGQAVSRTGVTAALNAVAAAASYAAPWGAGDGTTTFNVPNDQGYFWRSWNGGGSGIDPSRTFASTQQDAFQAHTHPDATVNPTTVSPGSATGFGTSAVASNTGAATGRTATETRPSNIAWLSCIKI